MSSQIRFGVVSESVLDGPAWADHARRVEDGAEDRDDPLDRLPAAFDQKLAVLRSAAGDRFGDMELSAFGTFRITAQRRSATEGLIARRGWGGIAAEDVWQMPTIYIGSAGQICDDLQTRRERFGLSYLVAPDRDLPTLAQIIAGL